MSVFDYVNSIMALAWLPFSDLNNIVFLLPAGCALFVFCLAFVRRLMRVMW